MLNYTLNNNENTQHANIPNLFLKSMPCSTTMNSGSYTSQLYLLPLPPNAYSLNTEQEKSLKTLYGRIETLLQKDFKHPNTRQKFNLLNNLYDTLVSDLKPDLCFLKTIVEHAQKAEQKNIIDKHRGWHWPLFHQTKTHQMFEKFQHELNIQNNL